MKNYFLGLLAVSLFVNAFFAFQTLRSPADKYKQFPYLSKRIFAENQNDILINFVPLRTAIREYVSKQPDAIGVYFEYLPSGVSIGVNEGMEAKFTSLVKIPIVMAVYNEIENGTIHKNEVLTLREEDFGEKFGDLWKRGAGAQLTVMEAINLALIKSDNTAAKVLVYRVGLAAIQDVFDSLDVPTSTNSENVLVISPKSYSSILRSLYLSSYLREENSNEILNILTQSAFNDELVAGIPNGVKVAHKIGVFDLEGVTDKTHNDCGIIYVPDRPYLLCIMTTSTREEASKYIQQLSKMVYGYVVKVKGKQ